MTLESIKRRIQALFNTGILKAYNEEPPDRDGRPSLPEIQFESLDGEIRDKRENITPYGFTHWPKPNTAEPLLFAENGEKAHTVTVLISDRWNRFKLGAEGEVAIYDDKGQVIHLSKKGITIKAPLGMKITGKVEIAGELKVNGIKVP